MQTYALKIAYIGAPFSGWQIQPEGVTIQQLLEDALFILLKEKTKIVGSGRTDTGVNALGQIAHFTTEKPLEKRKFLHSFNALLPKEIRILDLMRKENDFHARFSATKKHYQYRLFYGDILDPFSLPFTWHIRKKFDLSLMKEGAKNLIGTHDFSALTNESHLPKELRDCVRTVFKIEFVEKEGFLFLNFEGDGFLYKMVRNMVGLLVDVGCGKKKPSEISALLAKKDRTLLSQTAPPHPLFLMEVFY